MNSSKHCVSRRDSDGDLIVPGELTVVRDMKVIRDMKVKGDLTITGKLCYPTWEERFKKLEETVDALVVAQNESREKIQALLDYCFTDRSRWKEGQCHSSSAGNRCTLSVSEEGAPSANEEGKQVDEKKENKIESNA